MRDIKGKIYLLLAFFLAGTSVITGHLLTEKLGSFTITALSLGLLLLCLSPFYLAKTVKTVRLLKRVDWKMLVFQAFFGIFLFRIFLLLGLKLTSALEAGILTGATPAITALLAFIFLHDLRSAKIVLGIGCTVAGIILLQGVNLSETAFSLGHFRGNVLILGAAASESTFNVLARKHGAEIRSCQAPIQPLVQTLLVSAIAFLLCLIPASFERPLAAIRSIGWQEWSALIWYGLIITALAFVFFYAGVKRCDAYTTAVFSGMIPLTAMLLSMLLLNEKIGFIQGLGGILIVFSIMVIGRKPGSNRVKKTAG